MKKIPLFSFLISIVIFSGCTNSVDTQSNNQILPPTDTEETDAKSAANPTANSTTKEFTITAKRWQFEPSQITVNKGDTVKLKITSIDVQHGISIPEFNISVNINPGQETIIEFEADKSGTFSFFCSVYCGDGHKSMTGILIVN